MAHDNSFSSYQLEQVALLGQSLLERNQELESVVSQNSSTIEDQRYQLHYLNQKMAKLTELSESRLRVYDQLEDNVHHLEKNNYELGNANRKQLAQIRQLQNENDDMAQRYAEVEAMAVRLRNDLEIERLRRKIEYQQQQQQHQQILNTTNDTQCDTVSIAIEALEHAPSDVSMDADPQQAVQIFNEEFELYKVHVFELEQQREEMLSEIRELQCRLNSIHNTTYHRSFYDEVGALDETKEGKLCSRCLRDPSTYIREDVIETTPAIANSNLTMNFNEMFITSTPSRRVRINNLSSDEDESASSGVSSARPDTSEKATQTSTARNLLCCLRNGDDKLSIYDESTTSSSQYRGLGYKDMLQAVYGLLVKVARNKCIPLRSNSDCCEHSNSKSDTLKKNKGKSDEPLINPGSESSSTENLAEKSSGAIEAATPIMPKKTLISEMMSPIRATLPRRARAQQFSSKSFMLNQYKDSKRMNTWTNTNATWCTGTQTTTTFADNKKKKPTIAFWSSSYLRPLTADNVRENVQVLRKLESYSNVLKNGKK